jgi:hypothetical protein
MHDVKVLLKNGKVLCGPLWTWRPRDGWFSLVSEENYGPIQLEDVVSAVEEGLRTHSETIEDVDLLKRARDDGWVPKT